MRARSGLLSGTLALTMLAVGTARTEPVHPLERVRISYLAPAGCPDQAVFESGVSARLGRPWRAAPDELARAIRVIVTKEGSRLVARMAFTDATGRSVSRTVSAASCEEVVSGIALVTALAIQSQVFGEEVATPAQSTVPTAPAAAPSASMVPAPRPQPPPSRPSAWTHEFGLRFGMTEGLGPRHIASGAGALWGVGPAAHPSFLHLVADFYDTGTLSREGGKVRFRLVAGRLEVCPVRLTLARGLLVPACAGVEAGVLIAEGTAVDNPNTVPVAWVSAVLAPRLRLELDSVFAEVAAEERFPLVRREFKFRPSEPIHEIPPVAFGAVAALGLRFP